MAGNGSLIDEVDARILDLLQSDPRMSNKQIAQATRLSETTIGNRLERMSSQNIARVIGQSDFRTRGWNATAILDVTLHGGDHEPVIGRLNALPNVITIFEMAGPPHLIIKLAAGDLAELTELALGTIGQDQAVDRVDVNLSLTGGHVRAGFGNLEAPHEDPASEGDDLQAKVLAMLARNGRTSNREMARVLGVAEVTVRNRIKALLERKLLRYLLIRNPDKAGFQALAFAKFAVRPADIAPAIRDLSALPNVFGASIHTGPMNLLVSIYGRDWPETHRLFDRMCSMVPMLETPILRPAKRFARHRFELAFVG
jgi:DNA-binding Lrp family transcriptional regulator